MDELSLDTSEQLTNLVKVLVLNNVHSDKGSVEASVLLLEDLDTRGKLVSNLVLHRTIERIHVGKKYGDIPRGIFIVRGENVVLLGEVDLENESNLPLEQVNIDTILELQREQQLEREAEQERKKKAMAERGIHVDQTIDDF